MHLAAPSLLDSDTGISIYMATLYLGLVLNDIVREKKVIMLVKFFMFVWMMGNGRGEGFEILCAFVFALRKWCRCLVFMFMGMFLWL